MRGTESYDRAALLLPGALRAEALFQPEEHRRLAEELRLRCGVGAWLCLPGRMVSFRAPVGRAEIEETLERATKSSFYTAEESLRSGYFTVEGGFRLGLGGSLILRDGQLYNVTWSTKSELFEQESNRMRPIRFLDADGNSFRLKPGKTWVHVVMTGNPVYEVDSLLGSTVTAGSGHWKLPYISFKPGGQEAAESQVEELKSFDYELNR